MHILYECVTIIFDFTLLYTFSMGIVTSWLDGLAKNIIDII